MLNQSILGSIYLEKFMSQHFKIKKIVFDLPKEEFIKYIQKESGIYEHHAYELYYVLFSKRSVFTEDEALLVLNKNDFIKFVTANFIEEFDPILDIASVDYHNLVIKDYMTDQFKTVSTTFRKSDVSAIQDLGISSQFIADVMICSDFEDSLSKEGLVVNEENNIPCYQFKMSMKGKKEDLLVTFFTKKDADIFKRNIPNYLV